MAKKYIKLNDNDNHLSIGNLFRVIKDMSKNKNSAMQNELFCIMFEVEKINDTTVNNYCVGCRSIGDDYKQLYLNKLKKYKKDTKVFLEIIGGILEVIDGLIYTDININQINENKSAKVLATKLYNLSKNDESVNKEFSSILNDLIKNNKIYECLIKEFSYIVLEKKQPLLLSDVKKGIFENILNDTSISALELQNYLSLKLKEGINYDYSLKKLACEGNALANFELGSNEYYGYYAGYPRYDYAYFYLEKAAKLNHASANYMIGNIFVNGLLGNKSKQELENGYDYYIKAMNLGNVAAINSIGKMYLNGIYPLKKDLTKAIEYFNKAANYDYVYAYNNLGKIYEDNKDKSKAFEYYLISANLGDSWACNKVGEYYRNNNQIKLAFEYYNKALESNYRITCYYAYYNLAKYFYLNGTEINKKDNVKARQFFEIAANNGIFEALLELFFIYVKDYKEKRYENIYSLINYYKVKIECHEKYSLEIKKVIEEELKKIINDIEVDCLIV